MNWQLRIKVAVLIAFVLSSNAFTQGYVEKLDSETDFEALSGLPLSEKYGQVSALKLVYELKTRKIYFINSKFYKYHHEFCSGELGGNEDLKYFNKTNYSNHSKKNYLLANINYFKALGVYALEISPVDLMSKEEIQYLYEVVSENAFIGESLHLLLNSARLQDLKGEFKESIPLLSPSDIYRNLSYQAIGKYKLCGVLRYIKDMEKEADEITPMDIVVINETPLYLPKVSGIIITEFQTPLSHLTILGQNRKIPIAAYKMAFQDSVMVGLNNRKVCLEVLSDTFKIEVVEKLGNLTEKQPEIKLKYNLEVDSIVDIKYVGKKSFKYAGNKAANFGTLYQLSQKHDFKVPESAFVIPFYFYNQHVIASEAGTLIENLLASSGQIPDNDSLKKVLKGIRKEINRAPLDTILLNSINRKVVANGKYTRLRFRSSTNAEDAKGFSGAGLYTSRTGILNHETKTFEEAIKKVWASLWSYEAFLEREYYNINHREVYMGILVHRSFPNEEVNGVAITKNLYREDSYGFVVNAQLGNENVVQPQRGNVSDQFICYPDDLDNIYENRNTIDIITQSSLNNNKLVMTEEEIQHLANQLEVIKKYFASHSITSKTYLEFGLDVEFKLDEEDRTLYIKQVRIYND